MKMVSKKQTRRAYDSDDKNEVANIDDFISDDAPESEAVKAKKSRYEDKHTSHLNNDSYIMAEAQALLAPARVRGFSLVDKVWAFFLVDEVKEIKWAKNSFATLELEENFKKTISALVHVHGDPSRAYEQFDDVIAGKGKGLIFLLTGPPGLGKTLTAGMPIL
jgi:flagellar biosynthesis GTPase FlhF